MKIEAGNFYRTRNGKRAFVAAIIPDPPFAMTLNIHPAMGYIEGVNGKYSWSSEGKFTTANCIDQYDLIAEWEDKPEFRPFEGIDEFTPHLNRWIVSKERPAVLYRPFYVENKGVRIHFSNGDPSALLSWNLLFEKYMFLGGDCCGVRNT